MDDYEAEHIVEKTAAVRRAIRQFYEEFPQYCPYGELRQNVVSPKPEGAITKRVRSRWVDPEARELATDIKDTLELKSKLLKRKSS